MLDKIIHTGPYVFHVVANVVIARFHANESGVRIGELLAVGDSRRSHPPYGTRKRHAESCRNRPQDRLLVHGRRPFRRARYAESNREPTVKLTGTLLSTLLALNVTRT